jgi:hypothetical protein
MVQWSSKDFVLCAKLCFYAESLSRVDEESESVVAREPLG